MTPINEQRLHYYQVFVFCLTTASVYLLRTQDASNLDSLVLLQSAVSGVGISYLGVIALHRWLWKNRLMRFLLSIVTPNLNGRWLGFVRSSYTQYTVRYGIVLEIAQTLTSISVTYYDERAVSSSLVAGFVQDPGGSPSLFYVYRNEPFTSEQEGLQIHYGTVLLSVVDTESRKLVGTYYNHYQQRPTYGDIRVGFQSGRLAHRYERGGGSAVLGPGKPIRGDG